MKNINQPFIFRSFDEIKDILNKIDIEDDGNDEDFSNIIQMKDILLSENDIQPPKSVSKSKFTENEDLDNTKLEERLSHDLQRYKLKVQFLTEKVEEKKNQKPQCKLESYKREAAFIESLRSIRDKLCQQVEPQQSDP